MGRWIVVAPGPRRGAEGGRQYQGVLRQGVDEDCAREERHGGGHLVRKTEYCPGALCLSAVCLSLVLSCLDT